MTSFNAVAVRTQKKINIRQREEIFDQQRFTIAKMSECQHYGVIVTPFSRRLKLTKMFKDEIMKIYRLTIALTNTVTSQVRSFEVNNA